MNKAIRVDRITGKLKSLDLMHSWGQEMIAVGKAFCVFLGVAGSLYCIWLLWHCWQHARFAWKPTRSLPSQGHDSDCTRAEWVCQLVLALATICFAVPLILANGSETVSFLWHSEANSQELPEQSGFSRSPVDFGALVKHNSFRAGHPLVGIDCTCMQVSDEQVACLLRRAPELEWLNLSWTDITDDGLDELSLTPLLCCLTLNSSRITDEGLIHLEGLTKLQWLGLADTQVTDKGLIHLEGLPGLQRLDLADTQATDEGLIHLEGLTSLQELDLGNTQVTDEGLIHLKGLTSLQELDLAATRVTDQGLVHLEGLTSLQGLDLGNTQVTDEGLIHLKGLTKLRELVLNRTQVTEEGVKRLQRTLSCRCLGVAMTSR